LRHGLRLFAGDEVRVAHGVVADGELKDPREHHAAGSGPTTVEDGSG